MPSIANQIVEQLRKKLESADVSPTSEAVGTVLEVGDGIATISGLPKTKSSELLTFETRNGEKIAGVA